MSEIVLHLNGAQTKALNIPQIRNQLRYAAEPLNRTKISWRIMSLVKCGVKTGHLRDFTVLPATLAGGDNRQNLWHAHRNMGNCKHCFRKIKTNIKILPSSVKARIMQILIILTTPPATVLCRDRESRIKTSWGRVAQEH